MLGKKELGTPSGNFSIKIKALLTFDYRLWTDEAVKIPPL